MLFKSKSYILSTILGVVGALIYVFILGILPNVIPEKFQAWLVIMVLLYGVFIGSVAILGFRLGGGSLNIPKDTKDFLMFIPTLAGLSSLVIFASMSLFVGISPLVSLIPVVLSSVASAIGGRAIAVLYVIFYKRSKV